LKSKQQISTFAGCVYDRAKAVCVCGRNYERGVKCCKHMLCLEVELLD
jgi:hypothetical protein